MGTILSVIFGGGLGTKISMCILVAVLAIAGTFVVMKNLEISGLKSDVKTLTTKNAELILDNSILTENNKVLKDNQIALINANKTNLETVKKLDLERAASKAAIASLAASDKRSREVLNQVNMKIDEMLKDPRNDAPVAPILKETIRQIQDARIAQ